jgi:hypothetical protein
VDGRFAIQQGVIEFNSQGFTSVPAEFSMLNDGMFADPRSPCIPEREL